MAKPPSGEALKQARKVLDLEIEGLRQVRRGLGPSFPRAIGLMRACAEARGKIVVSGIGKSGLVGHKIAATLSSTGAPAVVLDATDALHGDLGIINEGDVALLLSNSGETEELLRILPALRRIGARVVSILGRAGSTLGRHSDAVLSARVAREACPHNLAPTASTTAMLALGDALAMALLQARGFRREDFARYHPAGALGQALLLKARDLIRPFERRAVAGPKTTVSEGLALMAKARSGCVVVRGRGDRLAGIFTHGDFARHYARNRDIGGVSLGRVMTRRPITIRDDALAAEAVRLLRKHQIDDLVVVDARRRIVGLIDSQDLPRLRLV
ncbi:MAG: KpsF/GutQ family sugar-phosphate isomerase [Verrucomicrobiae bacterium]|nr:KpsF/GutQ family sugar-phosphate isomerase [Verrucomicrobiae bacterium]